MHKSARVLIGNPYPYLPDRWAVSCQFWPTFVPWKFRFGFSGFPSFQWESLFTQFFRVTSAGIPTADREKVRWNLISRFVFPHAVAYIEYSWTLAMDGSKLGIWQLVFRQEFPLIAIDYLATWYVADPVAAKLETIYATFVSAYDFYNGIDVDPVPVFWLPASWAEANP